MSISAIEKCPIVIAVAEYRTAVTELNDLAASDIECVSDEIERRYDAALDQLLNLPDVTPSRVGAIAVLELAVEKNSRGSPVIGTELDDHRHALYATALRYLQQAA